MKTMPLTIKYLFILIASTFIAGELLQLYEYDWDVAQVYVNDPVYLFLTLMWLGLILWLLRATTKGKKYIPEIIKILLIITVVFYLLEVYEFDYTFIEIIIKSAESLLWLAAYFVSKNESSSSWFIE